MEIAGCLLWRALHIARPTAISLSSTATESLDCWKQQYVQLRNYIPQHPSPVRKNNQDVNNVLVGTSSTLRHVFCLLLSYFFLP